MHADFFPHIQQWTKSNSLLKTGGAHTKRGQILTFCFHYGRHCIKHWDVSAMHKVAMASATCIHYTVNSK